MAHGQDSFLELPRELAADEPRADACGLEAFSREQYGGLLQFVRRRTANEEDARDITQESLARLLRYRRSEPASWKPLLYRIATNVVGEQFRRADARQAARHVPLDDLEIASDTPAPDELVDRRQREAVLRDAILALPPRCRRVYLLSRMDGLSYRQIAQRCGVSVKTVEKHMTQALARLCEAGSRASGAS